MQRRMLQRATEFILVIPRASNSWQPRRRLLLGLAMWNREPAIHVGTLKQSRRSYCFCEEHNRINCDNKELLRRACKQHKLTLLWRRNENVHIIQLGLRKAYKRINKRYWWWRLFNSFTTDLCLQIYRQRRSIAFLFHTFFCFISDMVISYSNYYTLHC